ncbi:MAG: TRAP transporter large permease subunit, partial [Firmicutes bacterium]|nr:TRAP transporter large permease subunit [Bacillota bacterium]
MSPEIVGFIGIMLMFILMVMRIWVGVAMALVGFLGFAYLEGWDMALLMIGMEPYSRIANYSLAALPLFLFMGALVSVTGISQDLYIAARKWIGQVRGGLAMATAGATGLFAAICGDSVACVVTMCKVAYPEMKRYNYDNRLSLGTIAASGTVGILIPPSVGFILYGLLTEQSIGKLFIAGIGPGVLLVLLYMSTIYILCRINP